MLISHALNQPKTWVVAHGEYQLISTDLVNANQLVEQFLKGIPLPYILGQWAFYGRSFLVTPHVLIPRPETELLVEKALEWAKKMDHPLIVDVGTGSGAIAISLAAELPKSRVIATDISFSALKIAQRNAQNLSQPQIQFVQINLLPAISTKIDLICANLPYIPTQTLKSLNVSKWEPLTALDGGPDGIDLILPLLQQAQAALSSPGMILLEIEATLGQKTLDIARLLFPNATHKLYQDYAGHDRLVEIVQS